MFPGNDGLMFIVSFNLGNVAVSSVHHRSDAALLYPTFSTSSTISTVSSHTLINWPSCSICLCLQDVEQSGTTSGAGRELKSDRWSTYPAMKSSSISPAVKVGYHVKHRKEYLIN